MPRLKTSAARRARPPIHTAPENQPYDTLDDLGSPLAASPSCSRLATAMPDVRHAHDGSSQHRQPHGRDGPSAHRHNEPICPPPLQPEPQATITLDDLMATGEPDDAKPRHARRTLTAMAIAAVVVTAAATTVVAQSGLMQLTTRRHKSHAAAPAQQHPPPPLGNAPGFGS